MNKLSTLILGFALLLNLTYAGTAQAKSIPLDQLCTFAKSYHKKNVSVDVLYQGRDDEMEQEFIEDMGFGDDFIVKAPIPSIYSYAFAIIIEEREKRLLTELMSIEKNSLITLSGVMKRKDKFYFLDVTGIETTAEKIRVEPKLSAKLKYKKFKPYTAETFEKSYKKIAGHIITLDLTIDTIEWADSEVSSMLGYTENNSLYITGTDSLAGNTQIYISRQKNNTDELKLLTPGANASITGIYSAYALSEETTHRVIRGLKVDVQDPPPATATTETPKTTASAAPALPKGPNEAADQAQKSLHDFYQSAFKQHSLAQATPPQAREQLDKLYRGDIFNYLNLSQLGKKANNFSIVKSVTEGDSVYVIGRIFFNDGTSRPVVHRMTKDDLGEWRIFE